MSSFRQFRLDVLHELDTVYEEFDGNTPDHIILSKEIYEQLKENRRFEQLKQNSNPKRPGYIGMKVWWSRALDKRDAAALLISDEVFEEIVTRAEDFKKEPKAF